MKVTTGGISVGVGTLIVGALSVAGVLTVRDENNNPDPTGSAECQPQSKPVAERAERAYLSEHMNPDGEPAAWFSGIYVTTRDDGNDMVEGAGEAGIPASDPLPGSAPDGSLLLVMYDPRAKPPDLPSCFEDTPVLYLGNGPISGD